MTSNNLCDSCTNIGCGFQSGIVRTKCAFYMPPHIEPDNCGNYVIMQPEIEAIPKANYEQRLKADMTAMLEELNSEIRKLRVRCVDELDVGINIGVSRCSYLVQQKINALKGE